MWSNLAKLRQIKKVKVLRSSAPEGPHSHQDHCCLRHWRRKPEGGFFFTKWLLSVYCVLVGRDGVVSALVCLRSWKKNTSAWVMYKKKKIYVSQFLGCYKQDEGRLICLRSDTLLSQDGALLPHLLEREKRLWSQMAEGQDDSVLHRASSVKVTFPLRKKGVARSTQLPQHH